MLPISCFILARNEGQGIQNIINSVIGVVDEVIVIDTGSTDETKALAHQVGALVFDFEWCDDFSAARNFAYTKTKHNFVMFLDCDLELRIKTPLSASDLSLYDTFSVDLINQWDGDKKLSSWPENIVYDKTKYHWQGLVSEFLERYNTKDVERVKKLDWEVWHHSKETKRKSNYYLSLLEKDYTLQDTGVAQARVLMYWVQQLSDLGKLWDIISTVDQNFVKNCAADNKANILEYYVVALMKENKCIGHFEKVKDYLSDTKDVRKDLIMADLYMGVEQSIAAQYYLAFLNCDVPSALAERNWERYMVYPYIMLGNMSMPQDKEVAKNFFRLAAEKTRMKQKRDQLNNLIKNF